MQKNIHDARLTDYRNIIMFIESEMNREESVGIIFIYNRTISNTNRVCVIFLCNLCVRKRVMRIV